MEDHLLQLELVRDNIPLGIYERGKPRTHGLCSQHVWKVMEAGRRRPVKKGSVLFDKDEFTASISQTGGVTVRAIAESPAEAVVQFLRGETIDLDSPAGRALWLKLRKGK